MAATSGRLVSSLPNELPLLLIGGGLANITLARALAEKGHGSRSHVRVFDQFPASSSPHYSLNVHQWAFKPLEQALGRPGLVDQAAVDASLGGRGRIEANVHDIETGEALASLDVPKGRTVHVSRAQLAAAIKGNKVRVEHEKRFRRWELVRDAQGRQAISAMFEDGSEVMGCAVIGGDGVHSTVRAQLHPDHKLQVLPIVAYSGRWKGDAAFLLGLRDKDRVAYAHRNDNDVYRVDVGNNTAFVYSFNECNAAEVKQQWMYFRRPLPDGQEDPLWRPMRALGDANNIPDALYTELLALGKTMKSDLQLFVRELKKGETYDVRNWLMRTVSLPKEPSTAMGADRVFVHGDAAHGTPILAGESASHSVLDGLLLAGAVSKAFSSIAGASRSLYSTSYAQPASQGPVLQAIRDWEAGQRERWDVSVEDAEKRCMALLQPLDTWREGNKAATADA